MSQILTWTGQAGGGGFGNTFNTMAATPKVISAAPGNYAFTDMNFGVGNVTTTATGGWQVYGAIEMWDGFTSNSLFPVHTFQLVGTAANVGLNIGVAQSPIQRSWSSALIAPNANYVRINLLNVLNIVSINVFLDMSGFLL